MTLPLPQRAPTATPYHDHSEIAGPLHEARDGVSVCYRTLVRGRDRVVLSALVAANVIAGLAFVGWLLWPAHVPLTAEGESAAAVAAKVGFVAIVVLETVRIGQSAALWLFARRAQDPVPIAPPPGLRVAVLTTIVPSKEPVDLVARTLEAMTRLEYDGTVDVWILDEGDDPEVREVAGSLGVRHFSRKGRDEYNQPSGPFKARTKAGNHNAWRAEHEHRYDLVVQMDPDHEPLPCFLQRVLGYFRDPDVAFVVAPQVYGNLHDGFVQHAASSQAYIFHGVVQRGANALGAPLLIGTNHAYRPAAWRQIDGYQDSIIEDHLTSMRVHTETNPATARRWKGVYTPDILAVGEAPSSWTEYFNQQKRWAYGIWEILLRRGDRLFGRLGRRQRWSYAMLQFFYPSLAVVWVLGSLLAGAYLTLGFTAIELDVRMWASLWGATVLTQMALFLWLRRLNLVAHERRETAADGMLLSLFTGPVYVAAGVAALLRRPLAFAVTRKGGGGDEDSLGTFRYHLLWASLAGAGLAVSLVRGNEFTALRFWGAFLFTAALAPPVIHGLSRVRRRRDRAASPPEALDRSVAEPRELARERAA